MFRISLRLSAAANLLVLCLLVLSSTGSVAAEVRVPSIFSSQMVLQRDMRAPVWGWADPGEEVKVSIAGQTQTATAGDDGRWEVKLEPMPAGGPHELVIEGKNTIRLTDVLVGEVWICSGQSNMAWMVRNSVDSDLEILSARYPQIRLLSVPQVGTQQPQRDFDGQWVVCTPETVADFSAVGYYFGRRLQQILGVPIGLIDNAWGGSAAEAWMRRDVLEADEKYVGLLQRWRETERTYDPEAAQAAYEGQLEQWRAKVRQARLDNQPLPVRPRAPRNPLTGQHRPGNIYNGVLLPTIGYGIRGVIWYQGESNSGRAYQYRHLFPRMIQHWRDEWKQGDFPFYWVQLADFRRESDVPQESAWAELREAQTMTLDKLPHTGQAVIYDLGEADDIHPRDKQRVADRLVRWALANDYGIDVPCRSPQFASLEKSGRRLTLKFDHVGGGLDTFDVREPLGFAVAGEDRQFHWASARIVGKDQVEVWSDQVDDPVAARYAWADNPVANVQSVEGLKLTPFRTDDWPGVTAGME